MPVPGLRSLRPRSGDERVVRGSPLFDAAWYRDRYRDLGDRDPVADYLAHGTGDRRDPGPGFDARRYLALHPDVARSGLDPLVHYERFGRAEGRRIEPVAATPDAAEPSAIAPTPTAAVDRSAADASIEALRSAIAALADEQVDACLAALAPLPDGGGDLGRALWLAADGLRAERAGDLSTARDRMGQATAMNVPLPALLRTAGRFFKRMGDYDPAFRCFAILAGSDPAAFIEFRTGLPSVVAGRYLPLLLAGARQDAYPNLVVLGMAKSALGARLGPDAVGVLLSELQPADERRHVVDRRLVDLHSELRSAGRDVVEEAPERDLTMPSPEILGRVRGPGLPTRTRGVVRGWLPGSTVTGKSYAILRDDRAIIDARPEELAWMPVDLCADSVIAGVDGDHVVTLEDPAPAAHLSTAFSLLGEHSGAFGHWMLEFLPRLWCAMADPGFAGTTVLVDAQMPAQHHQALRWFVGPDHPVRVVRPGEAIRVDRLLTATGAVYMPIAPLPPAIAPPDSLRVDGPAFARILGAAMPPRTDDARGPARIYLSRGDRARRRLENREEIEAIAVEHGFLVVDPGDLPFERQVELVRDAQVALMPDGSAAFLVFLAGPGLSVGILGNGHDSDFEFFVEILEAQGNELVLLSGTQTRRHERYPEMSDYRIDPEAFRALLVRLCGDA